MAFEYRWNSTSNYAGDNSANVTSNINAVGDLDLEHCFLYELTTYADNKGTYRNGYFTPPNPPFAEWWFRDPTDGRTAPVALGYFAASQGWAWDRHKRHGKLIIPDVSVTPVEPSYTIIATQQYRFHCERCGTDAIVSGSASGPHAIVRTFAPLNANLPANPLFDWLLRAKDTIWRYTFQKQGHQATLDLNALGGYVDDSAHLGYGP